MNMNKDKARTDHSQPLTHRLSRRDFNTVEVRTGKGDVAMLIKTPDFYLTAFLLCQEGIELGDLIPLEEDMGPGRQRYEFVLECDREFDVASLNRSYIRGKTLVEPRAHTRAMGALRQALRGKIKIKKAEGEECNGKDEKEERDEKENSTSTDE